MFNQLFKDKRKLFFGAIFIVIILSSTYYVYQYITNNEIEYMLMDPSYQPAPLNTFELLKPPMDLISLKQYSNIKWSKNVLELNIRDLNKYIKTNKLNIEQILSIKKQRRQMQSRFYARKYRDKKKQ